jgi:hypothetical protein
MSGSTRFLRNTCQLLINAVIVHVEVQLSDYATNQELTVVGRGNLFLNLAFSHSVEAVHDVPQISHE